MGDWMVDLKRLLTVLIVVTLTWSCAKPPMSPSSGQSVSVAVVEKTSKTPRAGADVYISFGSLVESGKTDSNGVYTWSWVPDRVSSITITLVGTGEYESVVRDVPHLQAGDTRVDVEVDRRQTYTLSGTVFEATANGRVPVEGVGIEAWGCEGHIVCLDLQATTDGSGHYSIPGLWADLDTSLYVVKAGYAVGDPPTNCEGCDRLVTASVDTQLDIPLVRR